MPKHYRDGKRLGVKHGQMQRLRRNKRRDTSNWTCPHCGTKYRGTAREVERSQRVHLCPTMAADMEGMTWHA